MAGHKGMVGSAICRVLQKDTECDLITADRSDLDLTDQSRVRKFLQDTRIDEIYLAAAKVGGIHANSTLPAEFIWENLIIQSNVIEGAYRTDVNKLLFLGSSCIYPKNSKQPMSEDELLSGKLEPTNEPYAIAKIAGIKLCESFNRQYCVDYRSIMPTNLYGPNDYFHPQNSHVIPAMLKRFHDAKVKRDDEVCIWGTGKPRREFLHVDDMANASVYVMNKSRTEYEKHISPDLSHINVGTGTDCSIFELASTISDVVGYEGKIILDPSKPDGTMRKLLNVSKLNSLGWHSSISLEQGLRDTYDWYLKNEADVRT